jgi:hypothetical protein
MKKPAINFARYGSAIFFVGFASALSAAEINPDWIYADGLEFSDAPALYRISSIKVRDPHFIAPISPPFFCPDFTDNDLAGQPGTAVNTQLQAALDDDSEPNGFLDSAALLIFQNFALTNTVRRLDDAAGECTAPAASSQCRVPTLSTASTYITQAAGDACFEPIPGTFGSYNPAIGSIAAPCWLGAPQQSLSFNLVGGTVQLQNVRRAGVALANGPGARVLVRGFLRESDANLILLPPTIPLFGGQPITILLKGGAGNACPGSDKDILDGVPGWWFYLEQTLTPAPTLPSAR